MKAAVSILNLPIELVCHILIYLDSLDILVCGLVNKQMKEIIQQSCALQYKLELARHRMVSSLKSYHDPPLATRLRALRHNEAAWHTLASRARYRSRFMHTGALYEFQSGIFGQSKENEQNHTTHIVFFDLVKMENGEPHIHWIHPVIGLMVIDFTMDPSQDLLLLISLAPPSSDYLYEAHFRTLSTNKPHSRALSATVSFLERPNAWSVVDGIVVAHISGELTGLLIKEAPSGGSVLQVFNWQFGPHDRCQIRRVTGIDDFNFLSQDKVLIVRSAGVFEVYQLPADFSKSAVLLASYAFPAFGFSFNNFWYISLSSHPAPGYNPNVGRSSAWDGHPKKAYVGDPENRLHCCCIYTHTNSSAHSFVFFFRSGTFLNPPPHWQEIGAGHPFPWNPTIFTNDRDPQLLYDVVPPPSFPTVVSSLTSEIEPTPAFPLSTSRPPSPLSFLLPESPTSELPDLISLPEFSQSSQSFLFHEAASSSPQHLTPSFRRSVYEPSEPIPWKVWGPQSTRWFRQHFSKDWHHATYGLRTAELVANPNSVDDPTVVFVQQGTLHVISDGDDDWNGFEQNEAEDWELPKHDMPNIFEPENEASSRTQEQPRNRKYLRVKNFNPYVISQMMEEMSMVDGEDNVKLGNGLTYRVVTKPSVTKGEDVFREDIVSHLPYVEVTSNEQFDASDVMVDDERLLIIKRGRRGRLKSVQVLSL
ncbi:hypothetical protein E1B28_006177 [Marasmius oreades]|uniref:F-box domain-containing protein n=1 Tax=Marasmius oreades TaxID=181124 RepID=A0A9P7S7G5_9AGAR|nr:uncharacterized protein E1B28_006177 [Marasmius oreades]KAG7095428.1 hypothetical protein E1B28_006177 [Marasmius oreades]